MTIVAADIVVYSLFVTAGVTFLYIILLAVEIRKGVRFGKKFRQYMDQKTIALFGRLGKNAAFIGALYERGADEVEKDLIDPVTQPIVETQQRYMTLKTGEREIVYTGKRNASSHLRKIAEMNKRSKKKRRKGSRKQRKRARQQQRDSEGGDSAQHNES